MAYAHCGTDRHGREIGYAVEATCDHPDCGSKIDRGMSYACGGNHGENEFSCDKYFCPKHLHGSEKGYLCSECYGLLDEDDQ